MATEAGESEDPFLIKTGVIRQNLEKRFGEYQLSLQQRKDELSAKLDTAEREYTASRVEYKQKLQAMEQIQTSIKQQTVSFKSMEDSLLAEIDRQILQIKEEYPQRSIELEIDPTFNEKIRTLGAIDVTTLPKQEDTSVESYQELDRKTELETTPLVTVKAELKPDTKQRDIPKPLQTRDYSKVTHPIVRAVIQGDRPCDMKYPRKVAVDSKTGNIFIADQTSHSVKIYSQEGEYLNSVHHNSDTQRRIELVHPYGVCLYRDSLYVTSLIPFDSQPCIFKFNRNSESDTTFYYPASNWFLQGLFKRPSVISADQENGDVYVCDEESKVQVLDKNLNYKRLLTNNHSNITDLQVTREAVYLLFVKMLLVLSKQSGTRMRSFQLNGASVMCIIANSFYILNGIQTEHIIDIVQEPATPRNTGFSSSSTSSIFSSIPSNSRSLKSLSSFSIEPNPADDGCFGIRGITADESTQKIIVVCYSKDNMLQIY